MRREHPLPPTLLSLTVSPPSLQCLAHRPQAKHKVKAGVDCILRFVDGAQDNGLNKALECFIEAADVHGLSEDIKELIEQQALSTAIMGR